MKNQALFFSKDKSKKLKCRLLQFLFGAFRANFKHEEKDGKGKILLKAKSTPKKGK